LRNMVLLDQEIEKVENRGRGSRRLPDCRRPR
jgi:hypothetical protein